MAFINNIRSILIVMVSFLAFVSDASEREKEWGIGATLRHASIPFDTQDQAVTSFVPMMFFKNEHVYIKGLEAGAYLYHQNNNQINAITRMRFFDIPFEYQNQVQGDTFDFGTQYRYTISKSHGISTELMTDTKGHPYLNLGYLYNFNNADWDINFSGVMRYKSADSLHYQNLQMSASGQGSILPQK